PTDSSPPSREAVWPMARVIASWESSILRAVPITIAPNTVGEIVWPCLSKSRWPTCRSIWKRLLVNAGCEMPSASDALRKLTWSARASTCRYCRNSTRSLPGYRGDNLWKNQDGHPLAMPLAPAYQVSSRGLVPAVAYLVELFANAAKPGGELKLWDVTI